MMIFSGYSGWGWDVYSLNNPLQMNEQTIEPTIYIKNIKSDLKEDIVNGGFKLKNGALQPLDSPGLGIKMI